MASIDIDDATIVTTKEIHNGDISTAWLNIINLINNINQCSPLSLKRDCDGLHQIYTKILDVLPRYREQTNKLALAVISKNLRFYLEQQAYDICKLFLQRKINLNQDVLSYIEQERNPQLLIFIMTHLGDDHKISLFHKVCMMCLEWTLSMLIDRYKYRVDQPDTYSGRYPIELIGLHYPIDSIKTEHSNQPVASKYFETMNRCYQIIMRNDNCLNSDIAQKILQAFVGRKIVCRTKEYRRPNKSNHNPLVSSYLVTTRIELYDFVIRLLQWGAKIFTTTPCNYITIYHNKYAYVEKIVDIVLDPPVPIRTINHAEIIIQQTYHFPFVKQRIMNILSTEIKIKDSDHYDMFVSLPPEMQFMILKFKIGSLSRLLSTNDLSYLCYKLTSN